MKLNLKFWQKKKMSITRKPNIRNVFPLKQTIIKFADEIPTDKNSLALQVTKPVEVNVTNPITPRPNINQLLSGKGIKLSGLRDLMEDAILTAAVEARKSATLSSEYKVVQGESGEKEFDILNKFIQKNDTRKIIETMLDAPLYGYQPFELIWESIDGVWLPIKIEDRPPENFAYNYSNELLYRNVQGQYNLAPPYKFLVISHRKTSTFPYGDPLLTKVYWANRFKMEANRSINKYVARFMKPFVEAEFDPNELGNQFDTDYADLVETIYSSVMDMMDTGLLVHPSGVKLTSKDISSGNVGNLNQGIQAACNKEIVTAITGNESTTLAIAGQLGGNQQGSLASAVAGSIVESDQTMIANSFNILFSMINELNWNVEIMPTFEFFEEEKINKEKAERDSIIHGLGYNFTQEYLQREYNYKEGDLELAPIQNQSNTGANLFDYVQEFKAEPKSERILDNFISWLQDPDKSPFDIEEHLQPILSHIKKSKDLQSALDSLDSVYNKMDRTDLQTTVYLAMNLAQMYGIEEEQREL